MCLWDLTDQQLQINYPFLGLSFLFGWPLMSTRILLYYYNIIYISILSVLCMSYFSKLPQYLVYIWEFWEVFSFVYTFEYPTLSYPGLSSSNLSYTSLLDNSHLTIHTSAFYLVCFESSLHMVFSNLLNSIGISNKTHMSKDSKLISTNVRKCDIYFMTYAISFIKLYPVLFIYLIFSLFHFA